MAGRSDIVETFAQETPRVGQGIIRVALFVIIVVFLRFELN